MIKVLFVSTVVKTHIMEFHIPYLKMLKDMGWETAVASRNDYKDPKDCVIPYCDTYYDVPFERNPFKLENIKAYKQLKKIIDEGRYGIIHCHTPVGAMLTRLAATDARKKGSKVIYTAHGFHFYKGAPVINWLAYYPIEKALARKTDVLITINKEDYERAKSKLKAGRVEYVPVSYTHLDVYKRQYRTLPVVSERNAEHRATHEKRCFDPVERRGIFEALRREQVGGTHVVAGAYSSFGL